MTKPLTTAEFLSSLAPDRMVVGYVNGQARLNPTLAKQIELMAKATQQSPADVCDDLVRCGALSLDRVAELAPEPAPGGVLAHRMRNHKRLARP